MSAVQATFSLYEREVGPMPDKVSYAEKGTSRWRKQIIFTLSVGGTSPYLH